MSDAAGRRCTQSCRSCPCFSNSERYCECRRRCIILTSMTLKNPLRRFARCRMYDSPKGCDYFEWIDDSLCDKVRSMVVSLIASSETLLEDNKQLQRQLDEGVVEKDIQNKLKEKNARLKMENSSLKMENSRLRTQMLQYQMRQRNMLRGLLLLFTIVICVTYIVGGEK